VRFEEDGRGKGWREERRVGRGERKRGRSTRNVIQCNRLNMLIERILPFVLVLILKL
jgi:hypothetical protein